MVSENNKPEFNAVCMTSLQFHETWYSYIIVSQSQDLYGTFLNLSALFHILKCFL